LTTLASVEPDDATNRCRYVSSEAPPQTIEVGCSADVIVRVGSSSQP
jgi:hypothetical protein